MERFDCDGSLENLVLFEDRILAPLRVATSNEIPVEKMSQFVGWAKALDNLTEKMDPNFDIMQIERLFMALLDNPRLSRDDLMPFLPLFFEREKCLNNMKICIAVREDLRKALISELKCDKILREFLKSDRGDFPGIEYDSVQLYSVVLSDVLPSFEDKDEIAKFMVDILQKDEFRDASSQRTLLSTITDDEVLRQIHRLIDFYSFCPFCWHFHPSFPWVSSCDSARFQDT